MLRRRAVHRCSTDLACFIFRFLKQPLSEVPFVVYGKHDRKSLLLVDKICWGTSKGAGGIVVPKMGREIGFYIVFDRILYRNVSNKKGVKPLNLLDLTPFIVLCCFCWWCPRRATIYL